MKPRNTPLFPLFILAIVLMNLGCYRCGEPTACHGLNCEFGECDPDLGECICDPHYQGDLCDQAFNEKFSGTFTLSETCTPNGAAPYPLILSPRPATLNHILIKGLNGDTTTVLTAELLQDAHSFILPRQLHGTSGYEIEANGSMNQQKRHITLSYNLFQGTALIKECTASSTW